MNDAFAPFMRPPVRIIPRLDIKGPNLVKGIHLEGLRVLGNPEDFASFYYEQEADELVYMDVVASLYNRNSLHDMIARTARKVFIPLTVGGGIRTIEDIRKVLRCGADKVSLNTGAVSNPGFVREAARKFGSSTIVISIEAKAMGGGRYEAYTDNGREATGKDVFQWADEAERLGAGELLVTSIDREGTGKGFDSDLIEKIASKAGIPVIGCGGAGSRDDLLELSRKTQVTGMACASVFHYHCLEQFKTNMAEAAAGKEGNTEFLRQSRSYSRVSPFSVQELKTWLAAEGCPVRETFAYA